MDRKKMLQLFLIAGAASLMLACGAAEQAQPSAATVSGVQLETARSRLTPDLYQAVGTVQSATSSVVGAEISGTVRATLVQAGDRVRRGQLLALLDDRNPRAQVGAAQAGVAEARQGGAEAEQGLAATTAQRQFAEATFHRYQALLAKNSVSQQEFDNAQTQYKAALANERALQARQNQLVARRQQAAAQLASAETVLSYARVISPLDGVVAAKDVDAGTLVMPGTPLFTVDDSAHYRLEASLPAMYAGQVRRGEEVSGETGGKEFSGRVVEVAPATDPASRTMTVKVELPKECACQSGDYGSAFFPVGEEKILAVPAPALVEQGQLTGVFVVGADGTVEYRLVKTGRTFGERVEILSGLADGERIAVSKLNLLKQGVRVENP
jgi:membrane fusion protein, multidrug efflux system